MVPGRPVLGERRTVVKASIASLRGVSLAFLKLGCMAFGGPVAHLSFFQDEFVRKRKWLSESEYADLVALCQFLPGPASSQVGFAIGLKRSGILGAFAAWAAFTLPSAALMMGFALGLTAWGEFREAGWIVGLKLAAVAVVANAIWSMATKLCPDRERALIALATAALLTVMADGFLPVVAIVLGGAVGWMLFPQRIAEKGVADEKVNRSQGWPFVAVFALLLLGLPVLSQVEPSGSIAVLEGFYRAGSLVFGGGHVVLPLPGRLYCRPRLGGSGYLPRRIRGRPGPTRSVVCLHRVSWVGHLGWAWRCQRRSPGPHRNLSAVVASRPGRDSLLGPLTSAERSPSRSDGVQCRCSRPSPRRILRSNLDCGGHRSPGRLAFALIAFGLLRFASAPAWALVLASALAGPILF